MTEENRKVKIVENPKKNNKEPKKEESLKDIIIDWLLTFAIALAIAFTIKIFIMDATKVSGDSMLNTLHNDDMLMVNKIGKHFGDYERGDIVILKAPDVARKLYVKRIVAVPGDTIKFADDKVYLNGEELDEPYTSVDYTLRDSEYSEWYLLDDQYFVMGDNRMEGASNDSRRFGPVQKKDIVGHAFLRFYPFEDFGSIDKNPYGRD